MSSTNNVIKKENLKTILFIGVLVMIVSLIFSFLQSPKYKSSVKLLVVFNQSNIDTYTASRASNYITNILGEVIHSNSFVENVFKNNFNLKDDLGINPEQRERNWRRLVQVRTKENTGIILIDVFHKNREQADKFAQAITYTLITKHQLYHGSGDQVVIRMVDGPITSEGWAQPKFFRNLTLGFITGLILGFTLIVVFPEQKLLSVIWPWRDHQWLENNPDEIIELVKPENPNQELNSHDHWPAPDQNLN